MPKATQNYNPEIAKQLAAEAAMQQIEAALDKSSIIGVGSGSTVNYFIDCLAKAPQRPKAAVAASEASAARLIESGIPVLELNDAPHIPFYIDGADEANNALQLIKGGGGALTREKIIASNAQQFICIADEQKLVETLGAFPLPIEIIPMARRHVLRKLESIGCGGIARPRVGTITDNGNEIIDISGLKIDRPKELESTINQIAGVVCNGIFAERTADVLLLANDSKVQILRAKH